MSNKIYLPAWIKILSKYPYNNVNKLSKDLDITYSHIHNVLKELEDKKILIIKKVGRENVITLTDDGKELYNITKKLLNHMVFTHKGCK